MKKVVKTMSVLAAIALLGAGFISCSDSGSDSSDESVVNPSVTEQTGGNTGDNTQTGGDTESTVTASGTWDFTTADTYSIGTTESAKDIDLPLDTANYVTLHLNGTLKWGNGSKASSFWFKKASAYVAGSESDKAAGYIEVTLTKGATITIKVAGNGAADAKRWLCVCDNNDKVIDNTLVESLSSDSEEEVTAKLTVGKYKIYTSGSRLNKIIFN